MSKGLNNLREFGKFRLDAERKVLWFENETVNLPLKEIELLCVLTKSTELISKDEIINQVWADSFVEESNLSRHIYRLRKVFAEYGESEDLIETVPKRGYRFTGEIKQISDSYDLIIEKHSITRTIVEEVEQSNEPIAKALPPKPPKRFLVPLMACFAILAVGFGYYFYSKNTSTDFKSAKTIAVLPLRIYKENSKDETLSIRIADAVITRLGTSERIIVRPTNAILSFTNDERNVVEIGNKLQTETVLDGRIQQENEHLRVTLQLINVADGKQLWSGQIDGIATQILLLQDDISHKVLEVLDPNHKKDSELAALPTKNSDAYEAYLQGRYYAGLRTGESLNKAIEYFRKSVELDPNFAEGYAGLADTQYLLYNNNFVVEKSIVQAARENLQKSFALKPNLAEAFTTVGTIEMTFDWDWEKSENSFKQAIANAPNNSVVRLRYGNLLNRLNRFDEAIAQFTKAIELDPMSLVGNAGLGVVYFCKKDFAAADRQFLKSLEINQKYSPSRWYLSRSFWLQGRKEESINEIFTALELDGNQELAVKFRKITSPDEFLNRLLHEWRDNQENTSPHNMAYLSAVLGDKEKAIDWLEKSYAEHHPWTSWIKANPEFETLRGEPRYQELLRKMNLN
jgi:DNA-binding winged helix-turn-helix (wHTH) protein/TolB-like protein/lipoprotein NlpI